MKPKNRGLIKSKPSTFGFCMEPETNKKKTIRYVVAAVVVIVVAVAEVVVVAVVIVVQWDQKKHSRQLIKKTLFLLTRAEKWN